MINDSIGNAVNKSCKAIKTELMKVVSADNSMLDSRAIKEVLALKVDRTDLVKLNEIKSNKKDTEDLVDSINTLNK